MADISDVLILEKGVEAWNKWRDNHPHIVPDLKGANLEGVNLERALLRKAHLQKANLKRANLWHAKLQKAFLEETDLRGANLEGVNFSGARLEGANLSGANLSNAILSGAVLAAEEPSGMTAKLTKADLQGVEFTPKGKPRGGGSFLDLASCIGIETAKFSKVSFLQDYLADAFNYAHQMNIPERKRWPNFLERTIQNIKALRVLYADKQPPKQLIKVVGVITTELIKYLKKHPKAMYQIKPRQFEELVAEILASYGWDVQMTPAIKDGGYDIFAVSKDLGTELKTSWIIECKKYAPENKVGVDIVRALYAIKIDLRVANALLATTSYFTKGVKEFKASHYDIELKDYHNILEWINQYRPNPDGKLYIKNNRLVVASGE